MYNIIIYKNIQKIVYLIQICCVLSNFVDISEKNYIFVENIFL